MPVAPATNRWRLRPFLVPRTAARCLRSLDRPRRASDAGSVRALAGSDRRVSASLGVGTGQTWPWDLAPTWPLTWALAHWSVALD